MHTGKSTTGFCTFIADLHGNKMLVDWGSKLQTGVASSTPDAELAAVQRSTCRSSIPIQILMEEIFGFECPISHFEDNQPSITSIKNGASQNLRYMKKTQRISIPFLHDIFEDGSNEIDFVATEENIADLFTKFLSVGTHWKHLRALGLKFMHEVF